MPLLSCCPSETSNGQNFIVKTFQAAKTNQECFFCCHGNAGSRQTTSALKAVSPALSQSFEEDSLSNDGDRGRIQKAASAIISALSKRHNSTVMLAVVEVKVETQVESPPIGESHDQLFFMTLQS